MNSTVSAFIIVLLLMDPPGRRGLTAMERPMGMIPVIIAVRMFFGGVAKFLHLSEVA